MAPMAPKRESELTTNRTGRSIHREWTICGVLVLLTFAIVYSRSLSFVYIDGDDATRVAYHVLGRNSEVQPPYAAYESMLDTVLSILPPDEKVVRIVSMTLTAVSASVLCFLIIMLAFDWCADLRRVPRWLLALAMVLAALEFFYLGMLLTPSVIAMAFLVGAHLIIRRSTVSRCFPRWSGLGASVLLFGVGAAFRWDTLTYGAVVVTDLFLRAGDRSEEGQPPVKDRLRLAVLWGVLAGLVWLITVACNGWGPARVVGVIEAAGPGESANLKVALGRVQTLFTPGFAALWAIGLFWLIRRRHPLAFVTTVSIIVVAIFIPLGGPKWFITAIPSLLACASMGFALFWRRPMLRYATLGLLLLPWLIGLRMVFAGAAWGPGFEMQPYDRTPTNTNGSGVSLRFGSRTAVPTPEGPRPLFGHAWVLSGDWKRFVQDAAWEQFAATRKAIDMGVPLLQDKGQGEAVVTYAALGFRTKDRWNRTLDNKFVIERRFTGQDGTQTRMLRLTNRNDLFDSCSIERLRRICTDTVVISGYSTTLHRLHQLVPTSLEKLGKTTAVLHLDRLHLAASSGHIQ
jgi:hypothetical protein